MIEGAGIAAGEQGGDAGDRKPLLPVRHPNQDLFICDVLDGLSALLGHGYTVDNRAQPEMATFGVFRRRVPPIAMQNRRLPLDHWDRAVVPSDFR